MRRQQLFTPATLFALFVVQIPERQGAGPQDGCLGPRNVGPATGCRLLVGLPYLWKSVGFDPPEAGYTLEEALEAYAPTLVLCSCMPPNIDWSSSFRRSASVMEYLLIGPADSTRSGQLLETWGLRNGFGEATRAALGGPLHPARAARTGPVAVGHR